jgi:hypothetical protein
MTGEAPTYIFQFIIGACITQILLLVFSMQTGTADAVIALPGMAGDWHEITQHLTSTQLLLFGIFDIAGGIGFSAIVNGAAGGIFRTVE